jgi:hypothetical protein
MKIQFIPIFAALVFVSPIARAEDPSMPGKAGTSTAFQRPASMPPAIPSEATAPQLTEPRQKDFGKRSTSTAPNAATEQSAPIVNGTPDREMIGPMSPEMSRQILRAEKREIERRKAAAAASRGQ